MSLSYNMTGHTPHSIPVIKCHVYLPHPSTPTHKLYDMTYEWPVTLMMLYILKQSHWSYIGRFRKNNFHFCCFISMYAQGLAYLPSVCNINIILSPTRKKNTDVISYCSTTLFTIICLSCPLLWRIQGSTKVLLFPDYNLCSYSLQTLSLRNKH